MKMFRDLFVLTVLLAVFNPLYSYNFGVKAGINISNIHTKNEILDLNDTYNSKTGFNLGISMEQPLNDILFLNAGLEYNGKGYQMDMIRYDQFQTKQTKLDVTFNTHYLELPITLKAKLPVSFFSITCNLGAFVGYALSGNQHEVPEDKENFKEVTKDITWGSSDIYDTNPLDYGIRLGVGLEYSNFLLGFDYNYGIANMLNSSDDKSGMYNRYFTISLTFFFL